MAIAPATETILALRNPPSDGETLTLFTPADDEAAAVEAHLASHPTVVALRADTSLRESRPHLKLPAAQRAHNLTGGLLQGPGRLTVPPLAFADAAGTTYAQVVHVGADLCGHPGIVHGGLLATLLDEALARCCFAALPHGVGVTANLNINYRAPLRAGSYVVIRATTTRAEGRKAWVEGRIETLADESRGEKPLVIVEGDALFVSPRAAASGLGGIMPV